MSISDPVPSVPLPTLRRLPRYYQYLAGLQDQGQERICATQMAEVLSVHPTQVRKDLLLAGCLGRPKTGHRIAEVMTAIAAFLHWNDASEAFLVGAGHLGSALLKYPGFGRAGSRIVAAFDNDPAKIGTRIGDVPVLALSRLPAMIQRMHLTVGILTVPPEAAQEIADLMVGCGVRAIWNFAPVTLDLPSGILVENLEMFTSFALLLRRCAETRAPEPVG